MSKGGSVSDFTKSRKMMLAQFPDRLVELAAPLKNNLLSLLPWEVSDTEMKEPTEPLDC